MPSNARLERNLDRPLDSEEESAGLVRRGQVNKPGPNYPIQLGCEIPEEENREGTEDGEGGQAQMRASPGARVPGWGCWFG